VKQRIELTLRGNLQGIGLRPFLWRLAQSLPIEGSVSNTPDGVVIIAQGRQDHIQILQQHILTSPPEFARIDSFQVRFLPLNTNIKGFSIAESIVESTPPGAMSLYAIPDLPPCQSCIAELLDPSRRRFMDPMISCTQCGPRYSIQFSSPFDRCRTSMAP
jgi:hydrogenase maturation protein HypF